MSEIKAVVFDWAGTMIDFGSFAPVMAFVEGFRAVGIDVSMEEARAPMGLPKRDHVAAMFQIPRIRQAWKDQHGMDPGAGEIDRVYQAFLPLGEAMVVRYAELIPGALETVAWLRSRGIRIGSTTGYTRSIMEKVAPVAAGQGYMPDNMVCADDLSEGRPGPLGMYQCFIDLAVYPPETVIKVDDTAPGIAEGVAAGCTTVGVTLSGNDAGLSPASLQELSQEETEELRRRIGDKLLGAGAAHVIDTVADLPNLIDSMGMSRSADADRT